MRIGFLLPVLFATPLFADNLLFQDDFKNGLADGWTWVREDPEAWRNTPMGLEIRVLPGNMWGAANNAKNVLVRRAPDSGAKPLQVTVQVANKPTEQYEQVDLVWYYDDSNMVKIGLELVDQKLCVVMGREEGDRTRTIAIIPEASTSLGLRLTIEGNTITGHYRLDGAAGWSKAGQCTSPAKGAAKVSLQAYQGPSEAERWASITGFRIEGLNAGD